MPVVPPPEVKLRLAQMRARAMDAVLTSAEWLTAAEIAELAGWTTSAANSKAAEWTKAKKIFSIDSDGTSERYPCYGLDPENHYEPHPALAEIIKILGKQRDGWALASWLASENSFLCGRRPKDILATEPEKAIAAAQDNADGIQHG